MDNRFSKEQVQEDPTEPKRRQNPKRPLRSCLFPNGYSIFQNYLISIVCPFSNSCSFAVEEIFPEIRSDLPGIWSDRDAPVRDRLDPASSVPFSAFFILHSSFPPKSPQSSPSTSPPTAASPSPETSCAATQTHARPAQTNASPPEPPHSSAQYNKPANY